jgi:hypothetical protein
MSTLINLASSGGGTVNTTAKELILDVKISQTGGILRGQAVYVNGASGTNILVAKADNTTEATSSKTLGLLITSGADNAFSKVITQGSLKGTGSLPLNTSGAVAGDPVWLGTNGNLIYGLANKPYAPKHLVFIGVVVEANPTVGEIYVKTQNGFELDELHDVQLKGTGNVPTDGQVLTYEAATNLWKAKSVVNQDESPLVFVMAATEAALGGSPGYNNGTLNDGIGATLIATTNGILTDNTAVGRIDTNYIPEAGDLILVKNQVNPFHNGVYEITNPGSATTPYTLTRSVEVDAPEELFPLQINAFQGLVNGSKYFTQTNTAWGNTTPPVVGFADITFALTTLTTAPLQITFVDHATAAPLPLCTYVPGTDVTKPGVGATLQANSSGLLVLSGMTAGSSTTSLTTFTTLLVKDQAEPRHNGTYQVINPGSATTRWTLRRIDDLAAGFNKALRIVFCSHNVSPFAGNYYTPTWNPTLLNKNIGITVGIPLVSTNRIDYRTFTSQSGRFGIADINGIYTYYSTFQAAITAAVAGQTVEMFADVTETGAVTVTLKNGVNINGNGHTYTLSNTSSVNAFTTTTGVTTSCSINNITLIRSSSTAGVMQLGTNSTVIIDFTGTVMRNTGTGTGFSAASATRAEISNLRAISISQLGISTNNSSQIIKNCEGISTSGIGIWSVNGGNYTNCIGISSSNFGIYAQTASTTLNNCIGISDTNTGINVASNCYDCIGRSNSGIGIANLLNLYSCKGISTSGVGINSQGGFLLNCEGISSSGYGMQLSSVIRIIGCTAISDNNAAIWNTNDTGGGMRLYDCKIISNFASATGVGVLGNIGQFPQGFYRCTFILNSSLAPYLNNGGVAKAIEFASNIYRGGAVYNSNLTQAITSTEDNQGNIFV